MKKDKLITLKYDHKIIEHGRYDWWKNNDYFKGKYQSELKPFSIVLPPPNITGKLHLGHAWDGSLEDAIIRFKRLNGYDAIIIPGMDHAGIATQTKVESFLKQEKKLDRFTLGRKHFLKLVWEWKNDYSQLIKEQWSKLGLSLDYDLEKFTLDKDVNELVNYVFVTLYQKGLIYQGKKVVNWDPEQKTAISNIEVIYRETEGKMYYFKYFLKNSTDFLLVATTRPETIFVDQCLVVNPKDSRYQSWIGKKVLNPLTQKTIVVIGDEYVDMDFGTGVMKCTPGHDFNDFEIGRKYHLKNIICLNEDGTLNENVWKELIGVDRFTAREKIIKSDKVYKTFVKFESIMHQVGYSERTNAIVEPYLSNQWFVKMEPLAQLILDNQKNDQTKIHFFPKRFEDVLKNWMNTSQDWTISRQLWWGHQIPVWYHKTTKEIYVNTHPPKDLENWIQDEDVLDTWFSSALWPLATLNWKPNQKNNTLFNRYYPNSVLVTGYDIIFFWIARMMFQSLEFTKQNPFNEVLIHGLIRDSQGRKMSKSLGNGIDPMEIIDNYGTDALRLFLLTSSTPGQDLKYSEEKIRNSWNFINKLWNASKYVFMNWDQELKLIDLTKTDWTRYENINQWILNELAQINEESRKFMNNYEFGLAGKNIIDFVWNNFCSWYIELAKILLKEGSKKIIWETQQVLIYVLKNILVMLHPFIPFVTETLYQQLNLKKSIMLEKWEDLKPIDNQKNNYISMIFDIVPKIREFRQENQIPSSQFLNFTINHLNDEHIQLFINNKNQINEFVKKMINCEIVINEHHNNKEKKDTTAIFIKEYFLEIENKNFIDLEKIQIQIIKEKERLEQEIQRSQQLLKNANFLKNAKAEKIDLEKSKYEDYQKQLNNVIQKMDKLKK